MLSELGAMGSTPSILSLNANGPWSGLWQILAALALGGIVLIVILAIIEPGPLVKRRPFPREERSRKLKSEDDRRTSVDQARAPASSEGNPDRDDDS